MLSTLIPALSQQIYTFAYLVENDNSHMHFLCLKTVILFFIMNISCFCLAIYTYPLIQLWFLNFRICHYQYNSYVSSDETIEQSNYFSIAYFTGTKPLGRSYNSSLIVFSPPFMIPIT